MPDDAKLQERVMKLEMLFMHLEQTVSTLDEVVRSQQKALDAIEERLARLSRPAPADLDAESSSDNLAGDRE